MELYHHYAAGILHTHHRVSQTFRSKGFTNARSTLQNNIFLIFKQINQNLIIALVHIYFVQKIFFGVNRVLDFYFLDFFYSVILEQSIQFLNIIRIGSNIRQRFHSGLPRMFPLFVQFISRMFLYSSLREASNI